MREKKEKNKNNKSWKLTYACKLRVACVDFCFVSLSFHFRVAFKVALNPVKRRTDRDGIKNERAVK